MEIGKKTAGICCVLLTLWVLLSVGAFDPFSTATVTQTIHSKGFAHRSMTVLIHTDQETLIDRDNLLIGKWDESHIYDALQIGHTYNMTVIGWGIPDIGWYRNIVQVNEVRP